LFAPTGSLGSSNSTASGNSTARATTLYPAGRPLQILQEGYHWGKAVAVIGSDDAFAPAGIEAGTPGVYQFNDAKDASAIVNQLKDALYTFRFLDRYPLDQ